MIVVVHRMFGDYRVPLLEQLMSSGDAVWLFHHHNRHYKKVKTPPSFRGESRGFRNWLPAWLEARGYFFSPLLPLAAAWKGRRARLFILEGESNLPVNLLLIPFLLLLGIPYVWWTLGRPVRPGLTLRRRLLQPLLDAMMLRAARIACYGSSGRNYLLRHGYRPDQVAVAQNALHPSLVFDPENSAAADQLIADRGWSGHLRLAYIGALVPSKQPDVLLHAAARFHAQTGSPVAVLFVGAGPEQPALEQLAADCGVEALFAGRHSMQASGRYLLASHLVVLPGLGGLAINHAMMLGRAVICGRADGTEEDLVINGQTGWRLDPLTVESLADCLVAVHENPSQVRDMGLRARQHIDRVAGIENQAAILTCAPVAAVESHAPVRQVADAA